MAQELHRVTATEVPVLLSWLEKDLPQSWALYGIVREHLRFGWPGYSFYTLGWPEIQAAAMGPLENKDCGCAEYYSSTRKLAVYSPDRTALLTLLTRPGFVDWNQAAEIRIPSLLSDVVIEIVNERGSQPTTKREHRFHIMMANKGDVQERPIPEGMDLRPLEAKLHAPVVNTTWDYKRAHSEAFIHQLISHMPSFGLFDRSNKCLGHILGTDSGTLAILYVTPEMRGRGLASVLISRLARTYFELGLPAVAYCYVDNEASIKLHEKVGLHKTYLLSFVYHTPK